MWRTINFNDAVTEYRSLPDNNPIEAFALMKQASVLLDYHESELANKVKNANKAKVDAESTRARRSLSLSSKVEEGKRLSSCDPEYLETVDFFNKMTYVSDMEQVRVNMLKRIYYDCKMIFENSSRIMRENRNVV